PRSHIVVAIDVPNDPAVIRAKLNSPDAAGNRWGERQERLKLTSGMKNTATAAPCNIVGTIRVRKSASVLNCERMYSTMAKIANDTVANTRGSTLVMFLPTSGESRIASSPTGASTMPANVAVYPMYCCSHNGSKTRLPKNVP